MKYLLFISLQILLTYGSYAQKAIFYLELNHSNFEPNVENQFYKGNFKVSTRNPQLDSVFSKYEIHRFEKAFPTARNPRLQNTYIIETNDYKLMHELREKGKKEFRNLEQTEEPTLLYTPSDYGGEPYSSVGAQTNLDLINVKKAWDITKGIPEVVIGIADTYLDTLHVELIDKADSVLGNTNSYLGNDEYHNHGTGVTGLVSPYTDNYTGIAGVAYKCGFMFSSNMSINGLLVLSQLGAKVLNASWGSCGYSTYNQLAVNEIKENGTVLVASAGNSECDTTNTAYFYPASYDNVISVTSVGHMFDRGSPGPPGYPPNNWKDVHEEVPGVPEYNPDGSPGGGSMHHHNDKVDICAPGYNVVSLQADGGYRGYWGTSFSGPQVAAVCGLIISVNICLTADEVENILKTTAVNIDTIPENLPYAGLLGAGRVDAYAAVLQASITGTRELQYRYISTEEEYSAPYAIAIGKDVTVGNTGDLKLKAKHQILINENFEVEAGGTFEMYAHEDLLIVCP